MAETPPEERDFFEEPQEPVEPVEPAGDSTPIPQDAGEFEDLPEDPPPEASTTDEEDLDVPPPEPAPAYLPKDLREEWEGLTPKQREWVSRFKKSEDVYYTQRLQRLSEISRIGEREGIPVFDLMARHPQFHKAVVERVTEMAGGFAQALQEGGEWDPSGQPKESEAGRYLKLLRKEDGLQDLMDDERKRKAFARYLDIPEEELEEYRPSMLRQMLLHKKQMDDLQGQLLEARDRFQPAMKAAEQFQALDTATQELTQFSLRFPAEKREQWMNAIQAEQMRHGAEWFAAGLSISQQCEEALKLVRVRGARPAAPGAAAAAGPQKLTRGGARPGSSRRSKEDAEFDSMAKRAGW